jgi:hypothetical protein
VASNDFPRIVYKPATKGNVQKVWKLGTFATAKANDQAELDALLADGWVITPGDKPAAKAAPSAPAKA